MLAFVLCGLPLTALALTGPNALGALTWGWKDLVSPITSELKHRQRVNYGVFDVHQQFSKAKGVAIEHIFVSWLSSDVSDHIKSAFSYAHQRNRWLMVTIEPSAMEGRAPELLDDIVAEKYDSVITSICHSIGSLKAPMLIRWGHEMETGDSRYPWSGALGANYVAAYRHFAANCRTYAPNIYLVWSPKGALGLEKYYPGREFVDVVGLSLYELPAYDLDRHGKLRDFEQLFAPQYNRVAKFDRSVMIAELGVAGDAKYQASWMAGLFRSTSQFPLLKSVVYFNRKDVPGAWPEKYGIPDWSIDANILE